MTVYSILTESGSLYCLDTGNKTLERSRGEAGDQLDYDGKAIPYADLLSELTVDTPLRVLWKDGDRWRVRTTTPITEIVRMDVPASPD